MACVRYIKQASSAPPAPQQVAGPLHAGAGPPPAAAAAAGSAAGAAAGAAAAAGGAADFMTSCGGASNGLGQHTQWNGRNPWCVPVCTG